MNFFGTPDILTPSKPLGSLGNHTPYLINFYQILEVVSFPPSKLLPRDDRPLKVENDCSAFKNWDSDALPIGFCTIFWAKGFPLRQILVKSNELEIRVNLLSMMEGYLSLLNVYVYIK